MSQTSGLIFISCGQFAEEERELGNAVCDLVKELTPHRPYFADKQTGVEAVTQNILKALDDAVALIAIMHRRGRVVYSDQPTESKIGETNRASVWIEQEVAIAAYIRQILNRPIEVVAFIQSGIHREGLREQIILNATKFDTNAEVLTHLRGTLPKWRDLPTSIKNVGPPKLRFQFERGNLMYYLFNFINEENDPIIVQEIVLKHDGIELTGPLRASSGEDWKLPPQCETKIGKTLMFQKNPATALAELCDPSSIQTSARTTIDISVACEFRGHSHQISKKFSVRVCGLNSTIEA